MVKFTVLYGPPTDPQSFERHYADTHVGLVDKIPNLKRFEASRVVGTPEGGEAPYYRIAELWFENQATLQEALSSPEGQETVADLPNFASGGATAVISEVD